MNNYNPVSNRLLKLNIIIVILLGTLITYLNRNFRLDDALIYYRYVENFINGHGLVYNIGERFNALTSPLYIYISIALSSISHEVENTQTILNGFLLTASGIVLSLIFYSTNRQFIGFISSLILVSSKYFYMVFGLESNLFILLSLICFYLYFRNSFLLLSVFSSLLVLTRGEGIFLILVIYYYIYREDKNSLKYSHAVIFFSLLIAYLVFNFTYYDQFLPHTLTAKYNQGKSGFWGGHYQFLFGLDSLAGIFNHQAFYLLPMILFSLIGFANYIKDRLILILVATSFLITIFYIAINVPNYHWYYAMHFLTFYTLISLGVYIVVKYVRGKVNKTYLRYVVVLLIFLYPAGTHIQIMTLMWENQPNDAYYYIGNWLRSNTDENVKVACVEIGHIGWYSKRYIIDILGLVSPMNAEFLGQKEFDKWFNYYKPDYVIIHNPPWTPGHEQSVVVLQNEGYFEVDATFHYNGFTLLKATNKN